MVYHSEKRSEVMTIPLKQEFNPLLKRKLELRTGTSSSHCVNLCFNVTIFIPKTVFFILFISKMLTDVEKLLKGQSKHGITFPSSNLKPKNLSFFIQEKRNSERSDTYMEV